MITAKDGKLVEALRKWSLFPAGTAVPELSDMAVLRRGRPVGTGDLAWMPDADTYCLVSIREQAADRRCFGLAHERKPRGYVHVGDAAPHGMAGSEGPPDLWLTVTVVENTAGPFVFTGGTPEHVTPLREATVRFPSGRTITFVTYELPEGTEIPTGTEICGAGRTVCFDPFAPTRP
ncbi:hypothetical protein ACWGN5_33290 [Streptomyces sp. NPDC055815]